MSLFRGTVMALTMARFEGISERISSSRYSAHGRQWPLTKCPPLGSERIILFMECPDQLKGQEYPLYHDRTVHAAFHHVLVASVHRWRCLSRPPHSAVLDTAGVPPAL